MSAKNEAEISKLDSALTQIGQADRAAAKAAARFLNRKSRDNWTLAKKEWFAREKTIETLLRGLERADADVAVELIGALGAASQRYEFLDGRILDACLDLFNRATDPVRIAIAQAIPHFGTRKAWDLVLQTLSARPPAAAQQTVALAIARYGTTIEPPMRPRAAKALLDISDKQKNLAVLSIVAKAVTEVGTSDDLPALRAWLRRTDSQVIRDEIREAIARCSKNPRN